MTARTVNLLSEQAEAELYRDAGLDVASLEEEPFKLLVRCPADLHDVPEGEDCRECQHGCTTPNDPACPGRG